MDYGAKGDGTTVCHLRSISRGLSTLSLTTELNHRATRMP